MGRSASMRAPYGLQIIESCITCPYKQDRLFCNLPPGALKRLSEYYCLGDLPEGSETIRRRTIGARPCFRPMHRPIEALDSATTTGRR